MSATPEENASRETLNLVKQKDMPQTAIVGVCFANDVEVCSMRKYGTGAEWQNRYGWSYINFVFKIPMDSDNGLCACLCIRLEGVIATVTCIHILLSRIPRHVPHNGTYETVVNGAGCTAIAAHTDANCFWLSLWLRAPTLHLHVRMCHMHCKHLQLWNSILTLLLFGQNTQPTIPSGWGGHREVLQFAYEHINIGTYLFNPWYAEHTRCNIVCWYRIWYPSI